jgi:hypothetical protein
MIKEVIDLVGEHVLDAVDFSDESIKCSYGEGFEDCPACRFRLDGIVYVAVEAPDDGYRSHCREIAIDPAATMKNTFPAVSVIGRYRTKGENGETDDVIEFIDMHTSNVILEVGTLDIDEYYQEYVATFSPELMTGNV